MGFSFREYYKDRERGKGRDVEEVGGASRTSHSTGFSFARYYAEKNERDAAEKKEAELRAGLGPAPTEKPGAGQGRPWPVMQQAPALSTTRQTQPKNSFNPAAVLSSGPSSAAGRALLRGPMAPEQQLMLSAHNRAEAAKTTEERIKDAEESVADWEKKVGELKGKTAAFTGYGGEMSPDVYGITPDPSSTSYGVMESQQIAKKEDPALVAKSFLRDSKKRLEQLRQTKEWEDIHATGIEGLQDKVERLADDEGTLKQERDQVRKELNDLISTFEGAGGAWKQNQAVVKEYNFAKARLQGREAELTARLDEKNKSLAQGRKNLTLLQREKKGEEWERYRQAPDYEELLREAPGSKLYVREYPGMTKAELELYNYLLQRDLRDGTGLSREYMSWLGETLAQRQGEKEAREIRGIENPFLRAGATTAYGIGAGLDQFARGFERGALGWALPEETASSDIQYGSQYVREDLKDVGPEILGSSLGQIGYDAVTTTANMLPSVAMGAIHPALGAASIGLSAGGNAYDEAIREGYSPDQARAYAVLSGASEAGLQYFLGGISKLGNNVIGNTALGKQVTASIQNIKSASLRVAAQLGSSMLSEASEEYLQEILGPVFRNLAFGEDNEFHLVTEEAAYAALLAIITTGMVEGPEVIVGEVQRSAQQRGKTDIPAGMDENTWAALQSVAKEMYRDGKPDTPGGVESGVQAQKTAPVEDGGVLASLKEFGDGRRFVDVDTDQSQFDGLTLREQGRLATQIIKRKFAGKVIGIDNKVFVNGRTAGEYGFPLNKLPADAHEAKMRASTELDNLLDAGTNFRTEPDGRDGHVHPKAVGDFRYFDTVFKVGREYYSGVINIEPVAKGFLLKDITKIENITQDISSSYGETPKSTFLRDASMDSISQLGREVNDDFSLRGGEDILTQTALEMAAEEQQGERRRKETAIQNSANTFGKQGAKLFQEFYRDMSQPLGDYYGGFAAYYHAGLTGKSMDTVRSEYARYLQPDQAKAAYLSGQLDAAESRRTQARVAGYAPVAGKAAGLVADDYVASNMDNSTYRQLNSVLKLLGLRGRFVDGSQVLSGKANARIKGNEVLIAKDHQHPIRFVVGHEITHRLQQLAPKQYLAFRNFVAQDEVVRNDIFYKLRSYGEKGIELNYEGALDEAVADYAGKLFEDGHMMDEFIQRHRTDRTLLEKFRDAIRALVNKLTGKEKTQAQIAEDKLTAALDAAERQAEKLTKKAEKSGGQNTAVTEDGGVRASLKEYEGKDLSKDGSVYTYDFLTSLPDMSVTSLPNIETVRRTDGKVDRADIVSIGMKNARLIGIEKNGEIFIRNAYTGREIRITSSSIRHGLDGSRLLTNARLGMVIGDIAKNAIPLNALFNKGKNAVGTYAMAAYVVDENGREFIAVLTVEQRSGAVDGIDLYDVAHAINGRQKRGSRMGAMPQGVTPNDTTSKISIADFLNIVNDTHQSILSEDVLSYFGEERNPEGYYTGEVKFSLKGGTEYIEEAQRLKTQARKEGWSDAKLREELYRAVDRVYQGYIEAYGAIEAGENPAREIQVPRKPGEEDLLTKTAPEMEEEAWLRYLIQQEARRTMLDVDEETEARLTQTALEMYDVDQTAGKYRVEEPVNVERPTVPIINISLDELATLNGGKIPKQGGYIRNTVINRAKKRLGLEENEAAYIPASNISRGGEEYVLKVTKSTLNKMFSPADGSEVPIETAAVVEHLEEIANNAVWYKGEGDKKGRDQIRGVDHLLTTVYIDGIPTVIDMIVRVTQQAPRAELYNVLYYLEPEAIEIVW